MGFRPEEVSSIIQTQLEKQDVKVEMESVGSVLQVGDGIARVWGLEHAMAAELLEFPGGIIGMVLNLEEDNVGAVLFGPDTNIKEGDTVKCTGKVAQIPAGEALLGRVVNSLGQPLDGKGPIVSDHARMSLVIDTTHGPVLVRQIAGLVARRIVTDAAVGDSVRQGERLGIIRFGSRVDTFLRPGTRVLVSEQDRTQAGLTPIAEWPS